jgi:hypothetical protein
MNSHIDAINSNRRKHRIIILVIATLILLPLFVIGGFYAGFSWGIRYTDVPLGETWLGAICGGTIAVWILIALWIILLLGGKAQKPSAEPPAPPLPGIQEKKYSFPEQLTGVFTFKAYVYRQIAHDLSATKTAGTIVAITAFISGFSGGILTSKVSSTSGPNYLLGIVEAFTSVLFGLAAWLVSSWVLAKIANLLGGQTNTAEILRVTGFVQIFTVFTVFLLLGLFDAVNILVVLFVGMVIRAVTWILTMVGYTIGIREAAGITTEKAVVAAIVGTIVNSLILSVNTIFTGLIAYFAFGIFP